MKTTSLILILALILSPICLAEQVLWDDDSDIEIWDAWYDITGLPLTGADCTWQVYNPDGSLNQSGALQELSEGVFNFTVTQLEIGIYPLLINCTKGGYNGTSSKDSIKIVDELSEEYKDRLAEINQTTQEINQTTTKINILAGEINITTHNIYDFLEENINQTMTTILNLTNLTYENTKDLEEIVNNLNNCCSSLRTYMETKWGNEDADEIIDKLKDIRTDVIYLKSQYYYLSADARQNLLLSIKQDSKNVLDLIYKQDKWWDNLWVWIVPLVAIILLIITIVYLIKRKPKEEKIWELKKNIENE